MSVGASITASLLGLGLLTAQTPSPPEPASSSPAVMVYEQRPLRVPVICRAADFNAAGIECSEEEPCRIFLELTAVDAAGPKVVITGNLHTPSATLSSIVLASGDGGVSWREPVARVAGAGFEAVQLLNEQYGWIAAQPQAQFPTDPYLLATTDGGATWQKQPIWSEDGRAGLLQQFLFDSREHGFVLIDRSQAGEPTDRYELYETLNSGSSWMLREVNSRPITPKWQPRRNAEWRLRVDDKARTYELERRLGEGWRRVANFRTEVGECKAPETKEASQPPADPAGAPGSAGNP